MVGPEYMSKMAAARPKTRRVYTEHVIWGFKLYK